VPGRRKGSTAGPLSAGAGIALLALGLAACGGSGSAGTTSSGTPGRTAASGAPGASGGSGASGKLTPPGTRLRLGQDATVGWVPPGSATGNGPHKGLKLQVTVLSIVKGTIGDFKNVQLKPEEKASTPYYVKVRIKALGNTPPSGTNDDPDVTLDAIDDRGQRQSSIIFMGTFSRCDDTSPPKPFANGKSYESCLTYLMPGGGAIQRMAWNNGPSAANAVSPYFEKPVVWGG
jgi:hypothetical protein